MKWIIKNQKELFWTFCIGSLVFAIIGSEFDLFWLFYIGYGMCSLLILSGILYKVFRKKLKK